MDQIFLILLISVVGPIIGSFIGVIKKPSNLFLFNLLSFSAGVMLSISFLELIPESIALSNAYLCSIGIIIGVITIYMVDKLIPHIHPELCKQEQGCKLKKTAYYLIIGIFIHNFPEGMAIAAGSAISIKSSFTIALAIAIHNIPEGICTSAPLYSSSNNRLKSFLISSSTAIPIIIGFFVAKVIFHNIPDYFIGMIIASTAGLMIYISADELIPISCNQNMKFSHSTIFSLIIGVIFVIILSSF